MLKKIYLKKIIYSYFSTGTIQKVYIYAVFRIRIMIRRFRKFLDLMDLDPDPDPSINKQK